MFPVRKWIRFAAVVLPVLFVSSAVAYDVDDDIPEITARVARISYVEDDVQIRRQGATDWEKATVNLPLVEGDEVATSAFAQPHVCANPGKIPREYHDTSGFGCRTQSSSRFNVDPHLRF